MNHFYRLKAPILFLDRHSLPDRNGEYYEQIFPRAPNQPPRFSLGATNVDSMHSPPRFSQRVSRGSSSVAGRPSRRRLVDPTTCERDYQPDELEFMQAMEQYKRTSGRQFPTCSEVLEVVRSLGYSRAK